MKDAEIVGYQTTRKWEDVRLNSILKAYLPLLREWRNSIMLDGMTRQWRFLNVEDQKDWYEDVVCDTSPFPTSLMFMIEVYEESKMVQDRLKEYGNHPLVREELQNHEWYPVGCAGLCNIDWIRRSAEVSLFIGPRPMRRQGIGSASLKELKRWAYDRMNLWFLEVEVYEQNEYLSKFFLKNGFESCGKRDDSCFKDGQWHGSIFFEHHRLDWGGEKDEKDKDNSN